jgi:hypothetical protein
MSPSALIRRIAAPGAVVLALAAALAATPVVAGASPVPASRPAFTDPPPVSRPQATTTYTFGQQPLDDVVAAANALASCGLTTNQLAAMVLAPTYPETGATGALSPSPMTLSRYDTAAGLYFLGNPSTPYPRAFWHPGVGAWQFDTAGGWTMSGAQEISTDTAAMAATRTIVDGWCADTADAANPVARRAAAWGPWNGCGSGVCETIYQAIYAPIFLNVNYDPAVTRQGGMVAHLCQVPGVGPIGCYRVDPSLAQGNRAFAAPAFGPSPITAPFYDIVIGTTEYRIWLAADTGYPTTIQATLAIGHDARSSLTWSTGDLLCDLTTATGSCGYRVYERNTNTSGVADQTFAFTAPRGGTLLMCDWNGDGIDTPGVFLNGAWFITNATNGGAPQQTFGFGNPTDVPVCGDWNGDGRDSPGVYRNGVWFLTNTTGNAFADVAIGYGNPGDTPVVGDWNGDGVDTLGVYRKAVWYLASQPGRTTADIVFGYGNPDDRPVVGDWDGNGADSVGIVRGSQWFLSNTIGHPNADVVFGYGDPGDAVATGHWSASAPSTPAIIR